VLVEVAFIFCFLWVYLDFLEVFFLVFGFLCSELVAFAFSVLAKETDVFLWFILHTTDRHQTTQRRLYLFLCFFAFTYIYQTRFSFIIILLLKSICCLLFVLFVLLCPFALLPVQHLRIRVENPAVVVGVAVATVAFCLPMFVVFDSVHFRQ
jgi:hypothetical protein